MKIGGKAMRGSFWIVLTLVCALMQINAWSAPKYDALYVFGDSYCDVGNIYLATAPNNYPPAPYYAGRFSNGPIGVDHVASVLGVPLTPSLTGGTDYAVGGAWVTAPQTVPGGSGVIPSVPQQVLLYLSQHGGKADPNALYFLEGGGNDIVKSPSTDPEGLGYQIAVGLAESELALRRAGARHFVISNLFNIGLLPVAAETNRVAFATAASASANKWLTTLLGFEQLLQGVRIMRVDVNSLMNAVFKDVTHFSFTNVTTPCFNGSSVCPDPDHSFFWDDFHPTAFGHSLFAVAIENTLAIEDR
jgi:phospholipase/lecithinase/hemolysin